ncbi:MAG: hypothetical protein R2731_20085 [Nocardioides sp.]
MLVALHWGGEYAHAPSAFNASSPTGSPGTDITAIYGHPFADRRPVEAGARHVGQICGLGNLLAGQGSTARA